MEQNLKKCPLCGKEFDENADNYGFDIVIDGKDYRIKQIKLYGGEIIKGLCSQCLKAAAYGYCSDLGMDAVSCKTTINGERKDERNADGTK